MPAGCSRLKTSGMFPCVRNVAGKDSGNISFTGHVGSSILILLATQV